MTEENKIKVLKLIEASYAEETYPHVMNQGVRELSLVKLAVYHMHFVVIEGHYLDWFFRKHSHIDYKELMDSIEGAFTLINETDRIEFYSKFYNLYQAYPEILVTEENTPEIQKAANISSDFGGYLDKWSSSVSKDHYYQWVLDNAEELKNR